MQFEQQAFLLGDLSGQTFNPCLCRRDVRAETNQAFTALRESALKAGERGDFTA
jgi:hypothetical protein